MRTYIKLISKLCLKQSQRQELYFLRNKVVNDIFWRLENWNTFPPFKKQEKGGEENCKLSMEKYQKIVKLFVSSQTNISKIIASTGLVPLVAVQLLHDSSVGSGQGIAELYLNPCKDIDILKEKKATKQLTPDKASTGNSLNEIVQWWVHYQLDGHI